TDREAIRQAPAHHDGGIASLRAAPCLSTRDDSRSPVHLPGGRRGRRIREFPPARAGGRLRVWRERHRNPAAKRVAGNRGAADVEFTRLPEILPGHTRHQQTASLSTSHPDRPWGSSAGLVEDQERKGL